MPPFSRMEGFKAILGMHRKPIQDCLLSQEWRDSELFLVCIDTSVAFLNRRASRNSSEGQEELEVAIFSHCIYFLARSPLQNSFIITIFQQCAGHVQKHVHCSADMIHFVLALLVPKHCVGCLFACVCDQGQRLVIEHAQNLLFILHTKPSIIKLQI